MFAIGTRKSELALNQTRYVQSLLAAGGIDCRVVTIESHGDQDLTKPLYEIQGSGPGLFTKQLESALLDRTVDLAVHSLKDLPTLQPPELMVACTPIREVAHDVVVTAAEGYDPAQPLGLRAGLTVGTSSLRREALIRAVRPDLKVVPIRGNVPTRVERVAEKKVDAVILAAAGLARLALDLSRFCVTSLSEIQFVPAPGQGALAIEVRTDADPRLLKALAKFHDSDCAAETALERRILRELEGGCTLPLGVRCFQQAPNQWRVVTFLGADQVTGGTRQWLGFERFDISGESPETLVLQSVQHLRAFLKGVLHA